MPPKSLLSDEERFWQKVDIRGENDCWYWKAGRGHNYGRFRINNVSYISSRLVMIFSGYKLTNKDLVLHSQKCSINAFFHFGDYSLAGLCCNPNHLRIGTHKDNSRDTMSVGTARGLFKKGQIVNRGELCATNKLKEIDVLTIRNDTRTNKKIAKDYHVNPSTISRIKSKKRWGWL